MTLRRKTWLAPGMAVADTVDGLGLLKSGSLVKAVVVVDEAYEAGR